MKNLYYGNEESVRFRLRLKLILVFLILVVIGTAAQAQCPTPPGDPTVYGVDSWIGYVYSDLDGNNPPQNALASVNYKGYITQTEQFNYNLATGAVSGTNVCGSYSDRMSIRFRMQRNYPAGYYSITVGGDDGVRLSTDGGATWAISDWNYHSYQTTTAVIYLSGVQNMVLETYDQGGDFRISFAYNSCPGTPSTAPSSITATATTVCSGSSTTLTATGGTLGTTGTYQWGTGTTGQNILPDTTESITVNPTANTTYWVRRVDSGVCTQTTNAATRTISVTPMPTAPDSISGTTSVCAGASTTLTATGGSTATGSSYEWGTGSVVGSNVISGQTGASITVTPSTTTTYWVRRVSANSCGATSGVSVQVTVTPPPGDQVSYGSGSWIGYVYASWTAGPPPTDAFTTTYRGYLTQSETFDQNLATGSVSGANICGSYADKFAIRYKMTKYMSGTFTFTVGGDDGYRLSIDGGATWLINNWGDHSYTTSTSAAVTLNANTNFVLEYYENATDSRVSFTYTTCGATAPTSLTADTVCSTSGTNLYANGGNGWTFQWGTGSTVGSNVIGGQTNQNMWVNPTVATTYWVRRYDSTCNYYTTGQTITIYPVGTGPWGLSSSASQVCSGANVTLTINAGNLPTGSVYEWSTGASAGATVLGTGTATTRTVAVTAYTTYWVRIINGGSCPAGNAVSVNVDIYSLSTAPTSITGDNGLCSVNGINLYANGGTSAPNAQYQWGTGSVIGTNPISGQTNQSTYVNPTTTTTYWVRRYDSSCNNYTGGVTVTVYKGSAGPYNISGPWMSCAGSSVTLTADGTPGAGSYQWGTGSSGSNIISGATTNSITVTAPSATTTYWVRIVGAGTCGNSNYITYNLQVYTSSTPPTSISGNATLCNGSGQNLTANGISFGNGGGQYQWGTGSVVGTNPIANSNSQTLWVQPTTPTTYWVRAYDSTCNTYTSGVTFTQGISSTAPTGITAGATTICSGSSTTLTATGGYAATGSVYEWGTGWSAGSNTISGNTASISVSPTSTTTYWVRRYDGSPCNAYTSAQFVTITVNTPSVAPTSITGAPASTTCPSTAITLTASGGSGSNTFQWGTGSVAGTNAVAGTGSTLNVSPTTTTTYWVRRVDAAPCNYTAAAYVTVTVGAAPGTPSVFGTNQWNVYAYNGADINLGSSLVYRGYYVQNTLSPNSQDTANNGWSSSLSPSASAGWNGCTVNNDTHTFVYKRQGFPCGTYSLTMNNWDDVLQVYLNGTLIHSQGSYGTTTTLIGSYNLDSSSQIEIRIRENTGNSNMAMTIVKTDVASVAPTSVTGTTATCSGTAVTLTANGGTKGTNGVYQWGTGAVGSTILGTSTVNTYSVSPTGTTTYWVRFLDSFCGTTTSGVSMTVTVSASVAGTISTSLNEICRNSTPNSGFTLTGQTGSVVKWQYATNAAFTTGVTDIAVTTATLSGAQIGSVPATRYYRAVVQSGSCAVAYTNVLTITVPAAVTYNGTWSGTPTATTPVLINSNLALNTNLTVCACELANNAIITINNNASLIVKREVKVNAGSTFIIEDKGSLVQVDDDATDIGNVIAKRNTTPMRTYDFTYWSSPVTNFTLNSLSPNTLSDKYYSFNPTIGNWSSIAGGNQVMAPGVGYIIRAPQGWALTNTSNGVYTGQFQGVPNNGVINTPIIKSASPYNLIGNPYPSAIDIDLFITDAVNQGVVNGTVYLWTHNTPLNPAGGVYTYTNNDYAKYNLTGGVKTASAAITGGAEPTGKIASGQGFFIEGRTGLANGTYSARFNNSMRVANNNNQFFRMAQTDESTAMPADQEIEKHRIWVNLTNATGAYDEALVGYVAGATNEKDPLFDGTTFPAGNAASLYSILGPDKLSIQGRTLPFSNQDVVPMGYKVTVAGEFHIALEHFDGLFDSQDVFLLDKADNTYHNLKLSDYTFTTVTGQFDDRFEIHYTESTLGTGSHVADENNVIVIKNADHIEISSGSQPMKSVTLYDVTGKKIYWESDINSNLFVSKDINIASQVVIVKIELENDVIVTKKVSF
ncbi:Ig-like domain-containing protein [Flavobacterium silvaticum]|uniref:T9SS sorting signal type C domain-containing protein n=1 Tax=Flavobacterium silvaticum TaxID=1852020 RepID=A0A972JJL8_9FLAO|nr:T9SS sorting signal type C domain-containing protein [Flavobacterium silvaticum]NMH28242.1 T9SS sorting signal type C domain-containing protein [Flavobacterium silvaticum]